MSFFKCLARREDGTICEKPARYADFRRGGFVCEKHQPTREELRQTSKSRLRRGVEGEIRVK